MHDDASCLRFVPGCGHPRRVRRRNRAPLRRCQGPVADRPGGAVARNDVLYTTPSAEPWEAMPTGGGDLSAMVRWDGSLHLHLSKSDALGISSAAGRLAGHAGFQQRQPGPRPRGLRRTRRGRPRRGGSASGWTCITAGSSSSWATSRGPRLEVWGHPQRKVLVVEVSDPAAALDAATVELSQWRSTMQVSTSSGVLQAREVLTRPARPHLANTGMQDFFPADQDPLLGRGMAVVVACPAVAPASCSADGSTATLVAAGPAAGVVSPDRRRRGHAVRRSAGRGPARTGGGRPRGSRPSCRPSIRRGGATTGVGRSCG